MDYAVSDMLQLTKEKKLLRDLSDVPVKTQENLIGLPTEEVKR